MAVISEKESKNILFTNAGNVVSNVILKWFSD